jgi:hypothetical protein
MPIPYHFVLGGHLLDMVTIHAAIGMIRNGQASRNTFFDLRRNDFPAKKYRVPIG